MTIPLDIRPEIEAELARQAAAQGLETGEHAASLLEKAASVSPVKPTPPAGVKGYLVDTNIPSEFTREKTRCARGGVP